MTSREEQNALHLVGLAETRLILRGSHQLMGGGRRGWLQPTFQIALFAAIWKSNTEPVEETDVKRRLHLGRLVVRITDGIVCKSTFSICHNLDTIPQGSWSMLGPNRFYDIPTPYRSRKEVVFVRSGGNWGWGSDHPVCPRWDPFFLEAIGQVDILLREPSRYNDLLDDNTRNQPAPLTLLGTIADRTNQFLREQRVLLATKTGIPYRSY